MANPEHLKILKQGKQGVEAWNKWREENPSITPDLRGANFSGKYLIHGMNLGVNLSNADLQEANLSRTCLINADLRDADLSKADLQGADLGNANLTRALLRKTNLYDAKLGGAKLIAADLTGADLRSIFYGETDAFGWQYAADLTKAVLVGARLTSKEDSTPERSFLELACAKGLESVDFGEDTFLPKYIEDSFEHAHQSTLKEADTDFIRWAVRNINLLRPLLVNYPEPLKQLIVTIQTITVELIEYLKKHPKAMYQIKPRQFEGLIAEILASYGWKVDLTPSTKDGGYDIYAISPVAGNETTSWIIECKKYAPKNKIGVDIVRALYGLRMDLQVANAMLATTSDFSRDARAYKASRYDLKLKAYKDLLEWINQYHPNPNGKLYIKNNRLIVPGKD